MPPILKYIFVSGSNYSGNDDEYKQFHVDKNYLESLYGESLTINSIKIGFNV